MSSATKRGKLLPDLLLARDASRPTLGQDGPNPWPRPRDDAAEPTKAGASAGTLNDIRLNWAEIRSVVAEAGIARPAVEGGVPARKLSAVLVDRRPERADGTPIVAPVRKPPKRDAQTPRPLAAQVCKAAADPVRAAVAAVFCEKGAATSDGFRPWYWRYEIPADTPCDSASSGRPGKAKARQSSS